MFKRCGTPGYVAPEIINSSSKDNIKFCPKVDIFSAGVIFYILFIGKSPFKGKSFQEILDQNKKCEIDFNLPRLSKNPVALDLLQKMLKKKPQDRFNAKQCLDHEFFADLPQNDEEEVKIDFTHLKELHNNA
jgi:calcium/calmodulin-dependent protein kinase I